MKTTKPNFQKALKALAKGKNRLIYAESKTPGALLVCDGYVVLTIPQFEFDFFKEKNIPLITLGNLIYRADTALTAALTTVINGVFYA